MAPAKVAEAYSCPLFDNRPHAELIAAIDALTREVRTTPECANNSGAKSLEQNGKVLEDNVKLLMGLMGMGATQNPGMLQQPPTSADLGSIDQSMTTSLNAVSNIGGILNNSAFTNSKCGRQTMSTGKVLLALNDVINGLSPYALLAVTMNAALAPALPFVIGGAVVTSGISAISKMIDNNTLDMTNPDHRKALLQNTCQYTKVAKKVRFMQLAQSGKIEKITKELEKDVDLYKAKFGKPSRELLSLLNYRQVKVKDFTAINKQLTNDTTDFNTVNTQITENGDDLMVCTLAQELVNWGKDGKSFPSSAFSNLEAAVAQGDKSQKLQAVTLRALNTQSVKRISENAPKASMSDAALKTCAQAGRSWITGIRQAITTTSAMLSNNQVALEAELAQSNEYVSWKAQYAKIQVQQTTVKRVEKAMQELAKDNSIIDRSELAQRMVILKDGLFGARSAWSFGKPPVLAWIEHTKSMHDRAVSAFLQGVSALRSGSYSLTDSGQGKTLVMTPNGGYYPDPKKQIEDTKRMKNLETLTTANLPIGSRENEIACQQLENAWLDWSAAMDHLGAIQFFCDMIDPVLDVKMDTSVVSSCRGISDLSGRQTRLSLIDDAKKTLIQKGYQKDANLISAKLKELQCPVPAVSVMN
ncbi:MAG: hypothetical protein J7501_03345 [Bdellovibrio sp.]|nr:hypothetical protein [Bdellovibrio sp.]